MRLVVQRVSQASVSIVGVNKVVGSIGSGLLVLIGIKKGDSTKDADYLSEKLTKLRVMADSDKKMNMVATAFLVVSQFTLYGDTKGGNRPSFIDAASPDDARKIYEYFVCKLENSKCGAPLKVETGSFGDYMEINAKFDGPVTIILDS